MNQMKPNSTIYAYIGTYTDEGRSEGIYIYRFSPSTGELEYAGVAVDVFNPTYLAIEPEHRYLYSVNTIEGDGTVSAFSINPHTGLLTYLNQKPSGGSKPVHLVVDPLSRYVLAGNFGNGSVCVLPIGGDGALGEMTSFIQHHGFSIHPVRQTGPRVHSVTLDPAGRFAVAAEYGADQLKCYRLEPSNGELIPSKVPTIAVVPGSGPRHFAFHPSGKWGYVINELSNTLMSYDYNAADGTITLKETHTTLPTGFTDRSHCADVQVDPSGRFVYGSNRGHNSIVIYAVDQESGTLKCIGHEPTLGKAPRSFTIDPTGQYLLVAHQDTDNVVVFNIDRETGLLHPTGHQIHIPVPVCVKMVAISN
ncbi:lactonase family protein [Paenibacillus cremeus]|uniref:Lactonase family protein n=1 Tax=Paenibacillus cremeus TaxID=2163881 RepID=A0A559K5Y2_9BACL|nr:lactonase family protein [Paenibacillus cremeus]TVY07544.1 lactonase family protein [Paenibacillus cremeus]